jgi:hypothetical protein
MDIKSLKSAQWSYRKGIAQLINNQSVLLSMTVGGRESEVVMGGRRLKIKKIGFWRPKLVITEMGSILLTQTTTGTFGYSREVRIGGRLYTGKASAMMHFKVIYRNAQGNEVLSYHMNAWKWTPTPEFIVNESAAPAEDILLLLIVGYRTLRKLKQESDASVGAVVVTG